MVLVPYRELGLAVNDLAEGRLQVMLASMAALRGAVQAGKVKYLAVTNKHAHQSRLIFRPRPRQAIPI